MRKKITHTIFILLITILSLYPENRGIKEAKAIHALSITEKLTSPLKLCAVSSNTFSTIDYVKKYIYRYNNDGKLLSSIKLNFSPICITTYSTDKIYVGSAQNHQITIFDWQGTIIKSFGNFQQPSDATFDDENFLYVVDSKKALISVFNTSGVLQRTFGNDVLFYPTGIAFDKKNQRILVSEHGGITPPDSSAPIATIHVFNKEGQWLDHFGSYGNSEGEFTRILGLDVDQFGRIYIVDSFQGIVTILDENGDYIEQIGEFGTSSGQLRLPTDVVIDSDNRLWVTSLNNGSIEAYDLNDLPTNAEKQQLPPVPLHNQLLQNYPNPFNPSTLIPFTIANSEEITINIYNLAGQKIRSIYLGILNRGEYTSDGRAIYWDGKNSAGRTVASGFYFYELRAESFSKVKRMLFLK